jgi:predicted AAA+ superfamily ATPase
MRRLKLDELVAWKNAPARKPLIIRGARQVGKTWLMKEFGRLHYDQTVYVNFEKTRRLKELFTDGFETGRVLTALQAESGLTITPGNTLIIFDEIQAVPEAITSLKYFQEDAGAYHIVAAGSLLGVALHAHISFPVGKVDFMDLYPLNYPEFLEATGDAALAEMLTAGDWKLISAYRSRFIEKLKQYYYVGGMPEAVQRFSENSSFAEVREIQNNILEAYEQDFSKHAPADIVPRIRMVWNSIPSQLSKENRKFIYGLVKEGSRAKDYELALSWLSDCGQIHKVNRVTKPGIPLKAYEDIGAFKVFVVDIGLLAALVEIDARSLLEGNAVFTEFKGAMTEQFVFQQIAGNRDFAIYYWSADRSTAEVDFVIQFEGHAFPLEVKAEENLHAKSLKVYSDRFNPPVSIRTSMSDFRQQEWLINLPLYAMSRLGEVMGKGEGQVP